MIQGMFHASGLLGRAKPSDVPTDQSKLSILVQFMVETANSIQHRSSKLPWLCYLSLLLFSLRFSSSSNSSPLHRDIVSSLVKFNYLANDNFFNSTLTSLSLSNSSVQNDFFVLVRSPKSQNLVLAVELTTKGIYFWSISTWRRLF